jgi:hypothetical protein
MVKSVNSCEFGVNRESDSLEHLVTNVLMWMDFPFIHMLALQGNSELTRGYHHRIHDVAIPITQWTDYPPLYNSSFF